jgi:transcriptional regulator with XRE-family HTH domain
LEEGIVADLRAFGLRMKELRTLRKLTQEQLAEKCDVNSKYISRIEMGYSFPSFNILEKICDTLHVEMRDMFDFGHSSKTAGELRKEMRGMMEQADGEKLKLAYKTLKAILR